MFIKHNCDECPVEGSIVVSVMLRDGRIRTKKASEFYWKKENSFFDIISYKIVGAEYILLTTGENFEPEYPDHHRIVLAKS